MNNIGLNPGYISIKRIDLIIIAGKRGPDKNLFKISYLSMPTERKGGKF